MRQLRGVNQDIDRTILSDIDRTLHSTNVLLLAAVVVILRRRIGFVLHAYMIIVFRLVNSKYHTSDTVAQTNAH